MSGIFRIIYLPTAEYVRYIRGHNTDGETRLTFFHTRECAQKFLDSQVCIGRLSDYKTQYNSPFYARRVVINQYFGGTIVPRHLLEVVEVFK